MSLSYVSNSDFKYTLFPVIIPQCPLFLQSQAPHSHPWLLLRNPTPESPPHFPWNSGVPEKAHSSLCKVPLAVTNHASILGAQIRVSSYQTPITKPHLCASLLILWSLITGPRVPNPHPAPQLTSASAFQARTPVLCLPPPSLSSTRAWISPAGFPSQNATERRIKEACQFSPFILTMVLLNAT